MGVPWDQLQGVRASPVLDRGNSNPTLFAKPDGAIEPDGKSGWSQWIKWRGSARRGKLSISTCEPVSRRGILADENQLVLPNLSLLIWQLMVFCLLRLRRSERLQK